MTKWSPLLLCLLFFLTIFYYLVPVVVKGDSMVPNLLENQRLFVCKQGAFTRFDIVVFTDKETGKPLIKRMIGMPGETIRYENDQLFINGQKIKEPFLKELLASLAKDSLLTEDFLEIRVPQDAYFVLGDNRKISRDSRTFGMVTKEEIIGEAKFSFWPPNKIERLP